jgi:hypothetical protein
MLRKYFNALDANTTPPSGAVLTISVIETDVTTYGFAYSLSRPLGTNFTINQIQAYNYFECGSRQQGSIAMLSDLNVPAGDTGDIILADSQSGTTNTDKWTVFLFRINGTFVSNGGTVTIGGQTVTVNLQQCS